jgi:DNA-binding transcriptional MocR family regulator
MTISKEDLQDQSKPRYLSIADAFARAIHEGRMKPREQLPTHRVLAESLGLTVGTVTRAYNELAHRGLVCGEVGRGTFVNAVRTENNVLLDMFYPDQEDGGPLDLGAILPALGRQPEAFAAALAVLAESKRHAETMLCYPQPPGTPMRHRAAGSKWLRQWIPDASEQRILVTIGAQHGLVLACCAVTKPGDLVVTENWHGTELRQPQPHST